MCHLVYTNFQRQGAVSNMTVKAFDIFFMSSRGLALKNEYTDYF